MSVVSTESLLDEEVFSPSKSYRIEVFTWDEGGAWQSCCKDALDRQNMVRRLGRFAAPARAEILYSDMDVYPDELWGKVDDTSASGTIGQWWSLLDVLSTDEYCDSNTRETSERGGYRIKQSTVLTAEEELVTQQLTLGGTSKLYIELMSKNCFIESLIDS
jgi:hypothetical protein